jgi:AraC-like DNA-binding protein
MAERRAEWVESTPAAPLRPYVRSYLGYRMEGFDPGVHRGLPGRHLTFIISLDAPVEMATMPRPEQAGRSSQAFAAGLHAGPVTIVHDGNQHGVSMDLTHLGARALFGMPAAELASVVVDLPDLFGPADELVDRLVGCPDWSDRFAVLDEVLTRSLLDVASPPAEVDRAWNRLVESAGAVDVRSLAADVGWSRRNLTERFRREVGLTPKVAGRVIRFERSKLLLRRGHTDSLADLAASCGYYDQPHLNREWREMAGCSPTTWLVEEELPSVQDERTDHGGC